MPENGNNNINKEREVEKLLKDYAVSRSAALGDGIKMSSLRRTELLSVAVKTHSRRGFVQLLEAVFNLGLVRLGVAAAVVVLVVFVVFSNKGEKEKYVMASARVEAKTGDDQNNGIKLERKNLDVKDEGGVVPEEKSKKESTILMSAPVPKKERVQNLAGESGGEAFRKESTLTMASVKTDDMNVVASENHESVSVTKRDEQADSVKEGQSMHPQAIERILENFRVELKGSNIVLTESDGSKYEGVVAESVDVITNTIKSGFHYSNLVVSWNAVNAVGQNVQGTQNALNQMSQKELYFNVYGVNKSIKNYLEFSGRIVQQSISGVGQATQRSSIAQSQDAQLNPRQVYAVGASARNAGNSRMLSAPTGVVGYQAKGQAPNQLRQQFVENQQIIEGVLTIGNYTNVSIRAVMNQDGSYMKMTNQ